MLVLMVSNGKDVLLRFHLSAVLIKPKGIVIATAAVNRFCDIFPYLGRKYSRRLIYMNYTTFTNFSMKSHLMCKVYTDVGGIK